MTLPAHPPLKWAGGKTRLLSEIRKRLPQGCRTYHERFLGGGALFFRLASEGFFRHAVLSDVNPELIVTYWVIQAEVDQLIQALETLAEAYRLRPAETYDEIRAWEPERTNLLTRAARMIFLNKTCFNGLYRVNRSGQFNVPRGRYDNPKICDADNLRRCAEALQGVKVQFGSFDDDPQPGSGDLAYYDPPYLGTFDAYTRDGFGRDQHAALRAHAEEVAGRGVRVLISGSDTTQTREVYAGLDLQTVSAQSTIGASGRKLGTELLIEVGR